jgi:hypothetical protein
LYKIYKCLQKIEISYKKTFNKDNDCIYSNDYPYKNFWIDYLKIGRKFFKKSENFNTKSTIENEFNSSNSVSEFKIITNELTIILEENRFIENTIYLMVIFLINFSQMNFCNRTTNFLNMLLLLKI